tara:strand:- start:73 stop:630 length:558 start_codon:yes stop_codon:yes gene_type:complete
MNTPDIIFSIILLLFTVNGFRKGLIKEIARLTGLFLSCIIASKYHIDIIPAIEKYFINEKVIHILSFLILFSIAIIIINVISLSIQKFFEIIYLGWLNKLLGSLLGFIKGLIVISIIIFCMDALPDEIIKKIEDQSTIYKVGVGIKNKLLAETGNYNTTNLIDLNKISKDFQSMDIPILDSLIKK